MFFSESVTLAQSKPELAAVATRIDERLGELRQGDTIDPTALAHTLRETHHRVSRVLDGLRELGVLQSEQWVECPRDACRTRDTAVEYAMRVDEDEEYRCTGCGADLIAQQPNRVRMYRLVTAPPLRTEETRSEPVQLLKIVFLSSNPRKTAQLRLGAECREIEGRIRAAEHRDRISMKSEFAVRPDDLIEVLLRERPHVVHFSGHGSGTEEIVLEDDAGNLVTVTKANLVEVFRVVGSDVKGVILNACFSRPQAEALIEVVDFAVGMKSSIKDPAAMAFAAAFYRGIAYGSTVKNAFEQGVLSMKLEGTGDHDLPTLLTKRGLDAAALKLL